MNATVPKINVIDKQPQKSKYFVVIKFFYIILQIMIGLDFGFLAYKSKCSFFWKFIAILQSVILSSVCCLTLGSRHIFYIGVWYYVTVIHYFLSVVFLVLLKPNNTFYKLYIKLNIIDLKLKLQSVSLNLEIKLILIIIFHVSFRIILGYVICFYNKVCPNPVGSFIIFLSVVSCLFSVHITYAFILYSINCRLQKLASILKTVKSDFTSLQHTYKSIVELTEAYKTAFDPVFVVALLSNIPEIMSTIYYSVVNLQRDISVPQTGMLYFRLEYLVVAEGMLLTFAPALCASMLTSQVDKIKIILHDQLLQDLDVVSINEIERFIHYVEARGCRFRMYKVIPLDADLLGMVLSFCVTYLIVIIQFTNK